MSIRLIDSFIPIPKIQEIFEQKFKQLIENNKRLTHLKIYLELENQNLKNSLFKHITELDQLVCLTFGGYQWIDINVNLRQLSLKCLKIKCLNVCNSMNCLDKLKSFMTEVNKFKHLETLEFGLDLQPNEVLKPINQYFNGFQCLTHLTIDLFSYQTIKNDFLKDIDKSLPKLRFFCIESNYYPIEVSQQSINSLGRLSRLESIQLCVNNESILALITDKIKKNCKKIKTIDITVEDIVEDDSDFNLDFNSDEETDSDED